MSERLYYFKAGDGNEYGPISAEEVTAWQKQGRMNSESLVRYEDSNDWVPLVNMPELTSPTVSTPPVLVTQSIEPPTQQPVRYEEHRGTTILILGILSLMMCGFFTGIPAWIMGKGDLAKMDRGEMDPEGRSITMGGMVCGIITCVLSLLSIILLVAFIALGIGLESMGH